MDETRRLPKLSPVPRVAETIGVPKSTLYGAIQRGELPAYRLGRSRDPGRRGPAGLRLDARDVAGWLNSKRE